MKKSEEKKEEEVLVPKVAVKSEKEKLLELHKLLKDLGVNSISDLEVKIARL